MARGLHDVGRAVRRALAVTVLGATAGGAHGAAQEAAAPVPLAPSPLAVGALAPDFTLPSASAKGPAGRFTLSKYRGKTVVLAFFFKARTKG